MAEHNQSRAMRSPRPLPSSGEASCPWMGRSLPRARTGRVESLVAHAIEGAGSCLRCRTGDCRASRAVPSIDRKEAGRRSFAAQSSSRLRIEICSLPCSRRLSGAGEDSWFAATGAHGAEPPAIRSRCQPGDAAGRDREPGAVDADGRIGGGVCISRLSGPARPVGNLPLGAGVREFPPATWPGRVRRRRTAHGATAHSANSSAVAPPVPLPPPARITTPEAATPAVAPSEDDSDGTMDDQTKAEESRMPALIDSDLDRDASVDTLTFLGAGERSAAGLFRFGGGSDDRRSGPGN